MNDNIDNRAAGKDGLRTHILHAIEKGDVTMRPRWYFVLRTTLIALGTVFVFLSAVYLASFIIFVLYKTGAFYAPIFGFKGIAEFLFALPWVLIFVAFVFALLLEVIVQRYAFIYRRPLLYSVGGVLVLVVVGSVVVASTPLHSQFFKHSRARELPFFPQQLYLHFGFERFDAIHRGVIASVANGGFYVKEDEDVGEQSSSTSDDGAGNMLKVSVTPDTRFPFGTDLAVGDTVVVLGDRATDTPDTINAYGVEKVDDGIDMNAGMDASGAASMPPFRMPLRIIFSR